MQYETAGRGGSRYSRNMQTEYTQAMLTGVWMLFIGALGVGRRVLWNIDSAEMGYVSERWLAEYRASHPS